MRGEEDEVSPGVGAGGWRRSGDALGVGSFAGGDDILLQGSMLSEGIDGLTSRRGDPSVTLSFKRREAGMNRGRRDGCPPEHTATSRIAPRACRDRMRR